MKAEKSSPARVPVKTERSSPAPPQGTPGSSKKQRLARAGTQDTMQDETQAHESQPTMRWDDADGCDEMSKGKGSPKNGNTPKGTGSPETSNIPKGTGSPKSGNSPKGTGSPESSNIPKGTGSPNKASESNAAADYTQTTPSPTPRKAKTSPKSSGKRRRLCRSPVDKAHDPSTY